MTSFGNRIRADITKLSSYWSRVDLYSNVTGVYKKRETQGADGHVETEAEIGVMLPEAKKHPGPLEAGRILPQKLQREHGPTITLILDF